jgi:hypothetical protein
MNRQSGFEAFRQDALPATTGGIETPDDLADESGEM